MENATYPWTKSLTVFYVVLALWFYLAAQRKHDSPRMVAAFVMLAMGLLVHYSAGPYIAVLAVHYLIRVFPTGLPTPLARTGTNRRFLWALLATWFGWSMMAYGVKGTLSANTPIRSAQDIRAATSSRWRATLSIRWSQDRARLVADARFSPAHPAGRPRWRVRFLSDQPNFQHGPDRRTDGGLAALSPLPDSSCAGVREWSFWRVAVPVLVVIGIGVVGERDHFGSAQFHVDLSTSLGAHAVGRGVSVEAKDGGAATSRVRGRFLAGHFLQAHIEALDNTPELRRLHRRHRP